MWTGKNFQNYLKSTKKTSKMTAEDTVIMDEKDRQRELSEAERSKMVNAASEGLASGFAGILSHQDVIRDISFNDVLYLMRAGRYDEALLNAQRITPKTDTVLFLIAKSSILAGKCNSQSPQSEVLGRMYRANKNSDLTQVYLFWLEFHFDVLIL